MKKSKNKYYNRYYAFRVMYEVMLKWMYCDIYDRKIENVLLEKGIKRIVIYGAGDFGGLLYNKLKDSAIEVDCFADKYSEALHYGLEDIDIVKPERLPERKNIDLIIVTALAAADAIIKELTDMGIKTKMISLEEIIMRM